MLLECDRTYRKFAMVRLACDRRGRGKATTYLGNRGQPHRCNALSMWLRTDSNRRHGNRKSIRQSYRTSTVCGRSQSGDDEAQMTDKAVERWSETGCAGMSGFVPPHRRGSPTAKRRLRNSSTARAEDKEEARRRIMQYPRQRFVDV